MPEATAAAAPPLDPATPRKGSHGLAVRPVSRHSVVAAKASSEVVVESVGGKTNYVYGRAEAGIRYYNVLIDRPADEALIEELNDGML